jgi:uncharacterized membrane-anchored protein
VPKLLHIPENHAQRFSLHNEIHARPPVPLELPVRASHLALTVDEQEKVQERLHLITLCERFGVNPPPSEASHFIARFIIFDRKLQSQQAGRLLQRLFEIEIYRVMALLAFPISRELAPKVSQYEQRLSQITTTMALPECDDGILLDQMTRLAAEVESHISHSQFRFGAAEAYYKIVEQRIIDIREEKIQGIQTIDEFLTKRMQPAISSCKSTSKRFRLLSERISNASQLLRTRVDISIEQQNQALLTSMDKRAKIQLRFQETVEGLSIVAITTYIISLLHSSVKAVHTLGYQEFHPDIVSGLAIPFVLMIVAISVRRLHKVIKKID